MNVQDLDRKDVNHLVSVGEAAARGVTDYECQSQFTLVCFFVLKYHG